MAEQENDEVAAVEIAESSQDAQDTAYPVLNGFLDDLNNREGKTIQLNPETGEGIVTNIETGETRSGFVAELVEDIYGGEDVPQASPNTDGFVTLVENGELDVEVTSAIIEQGLREIIPELNENVTIEQVNEAENPNVTADSNASTLAADAAAVTMTEEQARRDTDARIVREAVEADTQQAAMGEMNLMAFFEMLIAMISGDQDAIADLMEKFGNNGQDNTPTQDNATPSQGDNAPEEVAQDPTPQAEQEEPSPAQDDDAPTQVAQEPTPEVDQEAIPATQENDEPAAPVPEDDNGGPTEVAQDEPQGYVNEGLGPLLTEVNKPADEQVSPLIASAMQDDVPQTTNILGGVFSANAGNEIGNENVIQVPFAAEAPVEDPQAQPMEIVNEPTQPEQEDLVNVQVLNMG